MNLNFIQTFTCTTVPLCFARSILLSFDWNKWWPTVIKLGIKRMMFADIVSARCSLHLIGSTGWSVSSDQLHYGKWSRKKPHLEKIKVWFLLSYESRFQTAILNRVPLQLCITFRFPRSHSNQISNNPSSRHCFNAHSLLLLREKYQGPILVLCSNLPNKTWIGGKSVGFSLSY